ncbi:xanthine dehydrogenase family protein subunit M [soil metagenome]
MKAFEYVTAQTKTAAPGLLGEGGKYLAGGIDLLGEMKEYITSPPRLVNIKRLPKMREITKASDGSFLLGANATVLEIASDAAIQSALPGLSEAASEVGSPQIRAVATLGGNLAQHSRCWYYRQRDLICLKRGGNTCFARDGQNKYHAIFSGNPCISPVVSNLAIALSALGAKAVVWRDGAEIKLSMAELYADAWQNPLAQNSLRPADLITSVEIPAPVGKSAYLQVSEKSDFDWALVSCAASGKVTDGKITGASIFLGAVAPVPFEVAEANQSLEGKLLDDAAASAAADILLKKATPATQNAYKIAISRALIRRTLLKLAV